MLRTYKATLKGSHLNWDDEGPECLAKEQEIPVYITFLEEAKFPAVLRGQGHKMAAALEQLAELHTFEEVTDPVAWQGEMRRDRNLPDRQE